MLCYIFLVVVAAIILTLLPKPYQCDVTNRQAV
jgi:hypothetical protein